MKKHCITLLFSALCTLTLVAQTQLVQTSFETEDNYAAGAVHNQNKWSTSSGVATVTTEIGHFRSGSQGLSLSSTDTQITSELYGYSGSQTGLQGICYFDGYFKVEALTNGNFAIALYDITPNSSTKRSLMIEFLTPSSATGKIKIYNGSSGSSDATYSISEWVRISAQIDLDSENSKVAINGETIDKTYSFRETWTPSSLGRPSGVKELHSIRLSTTASATTNIDIDDLYIGKTPLPDISFGETSTDRTITLTQPSIGAIALSPQKNRYQVNDVVTATCTLPQGYVLTGWTGDLNGSTSNPTTFTIAQNMTIGASTDVDILNPPARYSVAIIQPEHATISVKPESTDGYYYAHTPLTFSISAQPCYEFIGWNGDLSGSSLTLTTSLTSNINVGANLSVNQTIPTERRVTNITEWKSALNAMNPGDEIIVADGTYDLGGVTVTRSGCEERPIIIRAENVGGVTLINKSAFTLRDVEYISFQGFVIKSKDVTVFKLESCRHCRLTQNTFSVEQSTSVKWVLIGSYYLDTQLKSWHNRIDHNLFENKTLSGHFITVDGCGAAGQQSQYDRIDHNHFRNNTPRANNEKESIRVGVSGLSFSDGYTTIEYNLFEDCDGDPEIVSIKSSSNTVRYNTFRRCLGTLSFRQGFRNRAEGNYFFGEGKTGEYNGGIIGCGGMRIYGKDHVIINNYMEGLTGQKWDPAIAITNGDAENSSTTQSAHFIPENVVIAHNTIVNCASNIEIGFDNNGNYGKTPRNCRVDNNIIVSQEAPIIKVHNQKSRSGVTFKGNIFYPTESATMGITDFSDAEIRILNPQFVYSNALSSEEPQLLHSQALYKLTGASPAINSSVDATVTKDFEGQLRIGIPDVGADEYASSAITMGPLTPQHVGPHAIEYALSGTSAATEVMECTQLISAHYDSYSQTMLIRITQPTHSLTLELLDIEGRILHSSTLCSATHYTLDMKSHKNGVYLLRCTSLTNQIQTLKFRKN